MAAISAQELDDLVVRAASPEALPSSRLRAALPSSYRPRETQWRELLARLVAEGRLHKWPVRTGLYAAIPHETFARRRILDALADGPLAKSALERRSGVNRRALERVLAQMKASGELHPHHGRRLGSRPADDLDYVLRPELERLARAPMLRGAGVGAVRAAVARWAGAVASSTPTFAPGTVVLEVMRDLNPRVADGDLVYVPHLRTALKDRFPDKAAFDRAVLALAEQRIVHLQSHPVPSQIKPEERQSMIDDGSGSFYMAIGLRR